MAPKSKITINFNNVKWCTDLKAQASFFSKSGDYIQHQQVFCLYCPAKVTRLWSMSKSWQVFHCFNGEKGGGGVNVLPYFSETRPSCWGQREHEQREQGTKGDCPLPSSPLPLWGLFPQIHTSQLSPSSSQHIWHYHNKQNKWLFELKTTTKQNILSIYLSISPSQHCEWNFCVCTTNQVISSIIFEKCSTDSHY